MIVNIFHYHLNPGGVTRIIESQIYALQKAGPGITTRLICGSCPDPAPFEKAGVKPVEFKLLDYLENRKVTSRDLKIEYDIIAEFMAENIGRDDIIHFHNLNLGKNPLVTIVVSEMARQGYKVMNHAHDFAEDRPKNMQFLRKIIQNEFGKKLHEILYPDLDNYFFGTLNSADLNRLGEYGVPRDRRFLLPNPVGGFDNGNLPAKDTARKTLIQKLGLDPSKMIITYPVRVIERKNIGEFILLALLFRDKAQFLVTLPPKNPVEVERYEQWRAFCDETAINVLFEAGTKASFTDILRGSDFCITTSYREGFGMAFLEPWMLGTPVIGRDLPSVTIDIQKAGVQFSILYERLSVPGKEKDFKDLDPAEQQEVIRQALRTQQKSEDIRELNPWMENLLAPVAQNVIEANAKCIKQKFSEREYGEKLAHIYQKLA